MHAVWREYGPPAYAAVAAYLGLNRPAAGGEGVVDAEALAEFLTDFPGATGSRKSQA